MRLAADIREGLTRLPVVSSLLAIATLVYTFFVALSESGKWFATVSIIKLEPYGAFDSQHLLNGELWRLIVGQMVHSKPAHMLYNVISLLVFGLMLERRIGWRWFLLVWFFGGAIGTLVSTFTVPAPWHLGTGGSQAVLALAGFLLCCTCYAAFNKQVAKPLLSETFLPKPMSPKRILSKPSLQTWVLVFTLLPAFTLDVIFASNHLPKLGHLASLFVGICGAVILLKWSSASARDLFQHSSSIK